MAVVAAINELGSTSLNPRGNLWFNDESSYGHKLLAKMGWSKGKGLGKNENGIKENLKMKFKNTNSGLGYKDESYANVMKTEYESILKNLSAEYPQSKTINSTNENVEGKNKAFEQKSRIVKNRIRYPKLYYGKDVSKYSEKDMKSIFICSLPLSGNEEEKPKDSGSCSKKEFENHLPEKCETYRSELSISDYFNCKMKEKKDNELKKKLNDEIKQKEGEFKCSKMENTIILPRKKRCKKKKNSEMHMNEDDETMLSLEIKEREDVIAPVKKQKELSENLVSEQHFSDEKMWEMPKSTNNQSSASKKKRKKSLPTENLGNALISEEVQSSHSDLQSDTLSIPQKKKKKSTTNEDGSVDTVELLSVDFPGYKVLANSEVVNNVSNLGSAKNIEENLSNNNDHCIKKDKNLKNKLKKLKSCFKSKNKKYNVKNVSFSENISYQIIDSDYDESTDSLSDFPDKLQDDVTSTSDSSCEQEKDCSDNTLVVQDISSGEQSGSHSVNDDTGPLESAFKGETEECESLPHLPSLNSSYYNSWVESQKLALKMRTYKSMLKNIKKHNILKTTNLLSIQGYGNWGF